MGVVYIDNAIVLSQKKKKKMPFAKTWIDLENIVQIK